MTNEDIFCKIIKGEAKAEFVYQNEDFIVIKDIKPQAPVHLLIIPKIHIDQISNLDQNSSNLLGNMLLVASKVAEIVGVNKSGYRLILNQGPDSGQIISHLHLHLLGGKSLGAKIVK